MGARRPRRTRTVLGGALIAVALATVLTAVVVPVPAGSQTPVSPVTTTTTRVSGQSSGAGYRLLATAQAGAVFVNDPTFLIPYADQVVLSARGDLTAVNAIAEATPLNPGSAAGLGPAAVSVFCATCPPPPPAPDITASAQPPESDSDRVDPGALKLGDITLSGPHASAEAKIGDHVDAASSTGDVTGVALAPGASLHSASTHTVLRAPTSGRPSAAESTASAEVHLGAVTVVALARALPKPKAVIGLQQADGSVTPIAADGIALGSDARLLPSTTTAAKSARAGAVLERTASDGTVQRVTVLLTSAEALGGLEAASNPPSALGPVGETFTPSGPPAAATSALPVGGPSFQPARSEPTPRVSAARAQPVIRPLARPVYAIRHRPSWLAWLFLAWLCLGLATLASGRRWLAPRIAADASTGRAARAAALDHLDHL